MPELGEKVTLVTGGGQGIGFAIGRVLADYGAQVIIGDVREGVAQEAASRIPGADAVYLDVRDETTVSDAVRTLEERYGGVDVLVNNAGVLSMAPALSLDQAAWEDTMSVNATGVFLCCQVVGRLMKKRNRGGRIINISSLAARVPMPGQVHYCASKAAVSSLTRGFALELGSAGITTNSVCPGAVDTELFAAACAGTAAERGVSPETVQSEWLERVSIGRLIDPVEIGELVAFLASDAAAGINGQNICIDGGRW